MLRRGVTSGWVAVVVAAITGTSCGDDSSTGPVEGTFTLEPQTQWSGGVVEATSSAFATAADWVVLVDGDTAVSWRVDPGVIAFELPNPKLTGTSTVDIETPGAELRPGSVDVVGNAWPSRSLECSSAQPCSLPILDGAAHDYHGVRLPAGQLLAFFQGVESGRDGGFGIASLEGLHPVVDWLPGLTASELPGLAAPGQSAEINQWVFDTSSADTPQQPSVWQLAQPVGPVQPLACLPGGITGGYALVELPAGDCLVLTYPGLQESGSLTLNANTPIVGYADIPWGWTAGCAGFRSSSDGQWTTLRSMQGPWFCEQATAEGLPSWPVFDGSGSLSFSSSRYAGWVRGADFTPRGDTLWVVGAAPSWSLDTWNPSSGELLREVLLEDYSRCEDVLVDPVRPYVYAACRREGAGTSWPSLLVIDRDGGDLVAVLEPLTSGNVLPFLSPIALVFGGSSGRVHLTGVWDGTSAPVDRGVHVVSWDIQ